MVVLALLQVRLLNVDVKEARASSTVQIIGRKDLNRSGFPDGPQSVSNAAHRSLLRCDALLPIQETVHVITAMSVMKVYIWLCKDAQYF